MKVEICREENCFEPRDETSNSALCYKHRLAKNRAAGARWRQNMTPEEKENYLARVRFTQLKARLAKLKLTIEDYNFTLAKQNYCCAICLCADPGGKGGWHIDHDHTTGKFRGLLCHSCNIALGCFKDSIKVLEHAIKYLRNQPSYPLLADP